MQCTELSPFGLELSGVSLDRLDAAQLTEVRRLLTTAGVVVFREQCIDDDAFVAFLERFAPLTFTVGETPVADQPKLNVVSNVGRRTAPRSVFHSDTSYVSQPPSFTALRAVTVPAAGGETLFSSQYLAFEALPEHRRSLLRRARVLHQVTGLTLDESAETACWHPLFRRHPESGRTALYLSTPERCVALADADVTEPAALLRELYELSTAPERVYAHRWQPGDVVMWDNRCTMHRADHSAVVGDRVMHRGMCAGEAPLAAEADPRQAPRIA